MTLYGEILTTKVFFQRLLKEKSTKTVNTVFTKLGVLLMELKTYSLTEFSKKVYFDFIYLVHW